MSLSKMAPLAWAYYAEEIGGGREDYYATASERPGRSLGRGAEALGLAGVEGTAQAMERLFGQGCDPRGGRALGRGFSPEDERAVAGFALAFSPPKTVSVLLALGSDEVSAGVLGAHEAAVEEAMAFLEVHAAMRATCFQIAAYRTRAPKVEANTTTATLKARWHEEAKGFGHAADAWLAGVLGHERVVEGAPGVKALATVVSRLEERSATWGRSDVVEECSRLVTGPDAGGVRRLVEALADEVLRDPEVVSLAAPLPAEAPSSLRRRDQMAQFERHGAVRFATTGTLRREAFVLEAAAEGVAAGIAVVPGGIVEAVLTGDVLADGTLGNDQAAEVRGLLTGGEQVAFLVGPAGAGKSRALEAARRAWSAAGHEVLGLAPSAMAAAVLEEASGIGSETLAKALRDLGQGGSSLAPSSVVVLDEAGMARTDDLARLVEAVKGAGAKLVLVGDSDQLGAVGPGGLLRTLVDDHGAHELETIRRFEHAWEAAASLRLRSRDPSILPAYLANDRMAEGSRTAMLEEAPSAWRAAREEGKDLLVIASACSASSSAERPHRASAQNDGPTRRRRHADRHVWS